MPAVAIIGAGLIGRAWAQVFARAGSQATSAAAAPSATAVGAAPWAVRVWDPSAAVRDDARALIASGLDDLASHGLVADAAAAQARVVVCASLAEAVDGVDFVQESGPEQVEIKRQTFAELDNVAPPRAILASSTSAIVASRFTEGLAGRHRCLVGHPVNPPHLAPVVEVCGAPWTDPAVARRARDIYRSVGQVPIDVRREVDGFILNRLQGALLSEAFRLVGEGYCSPQDLDRTLSEGLGRRWAFMGPFATIELNAPGGIADYCERYTGFYRRLQSEPAPATVWDRDNWSAIVAEWDGSETRARVVGTAGLADAIADKTRWRDARLAALAAHLAGEADWPVDPSAT